MKKFTLFLFLTICFTHINIFSESRQSIVNRLFENVEDWLGTPYRWGGMSAKGIDCSGLVVTIYKNTFNIDLPRKAKNIAKLGNTVKDRLQPGDLLFFDTIGGISHVGIYLFNNKFVHSASGKNNRGVVKNSLEESYYKKHYLFAKRLINLPAAKKNQLNETTVSKEQQTAGNQKTGEAKHKDNFDNQPQISMISKSANDEVDISLDIGSSIFAGRVTFNSQKLNIKRPIYLGLELEPGYLEEIVIDLYKNGSFLNRKKIRLPYDKNYYWYRLYLKKGDYTARIYDNNDRLQYEKDFTVYLQAYQF